MRADPAMADELVWAGFDMVSLANNHTGDYGPLGTRLTRQYVRASGLVGSGSGENLFEAREARFLDTADGRVALISLASTFPTSSMAGKPGAANPGRPGVNFLRHERARIITQEQMDALRTGLEAGGVIQAGRGGNGDRLTALGTRFEVGPEAGNRTTPNADDVADITQVVADARRLADYVIVSIHAHESGPGGRGYPADFVVEFAHAVVDAGADLLVGHGPHVLRGVEIYKGKPILYSLGDFMFQNETLLRLPAENFSTYDLDPDAGVSSFNFERYSGDTRGFPSDQEIWESVLAVPSFQDGALVELRFFPLTLGFGEAATIRGRPQYATGELATKILADLIERSGRFGVEIDDLGGIGVLRPEGGEG
jgi:poly-gamma-glutamate synthesis protein (capsule biosynthesis protein)